MPLCRLPASRISPASRIAHHPAVCRLTSASESPMRPFALAAALIALSATPAFAAEDGAKPGLLDPHYGLMTWTILIFLTLMFLLRKFAWSPILGAVRSREQALSDAMAAAERDRNDAARLLAEQKAAIETARNEAQRYIAEGRATAESMRSEMLESTRAQQAELLDRARKEIESEKVKAIDALRREAVDLALAGASKLISQKLDGAGDRAIVEQYLASLGKK
jgi:F-type H+-transporting ATPase subunit b